MNPEQGQRYVINSQDEYNGRIFILLELHEYGWSWGWEKESLKVSPENMVVHKKVIDTKSLQENISCGRYKLTQSEEFNGLSSRLDTIE